MAWITIPTSADITIEINGRKIAAAQSYRVKSSRESKYIEAFGSSEPVGTVGGRVRHWLELSRVCLCDGSGLDFYSLSNFSVVIVKPDEKIIYSGCEWSDIVQAASINEVVLEKVSLVAGKRLRIGKGN